jgi:hypothetical protein
MMEKNVVQRLCLDNILWSCCDGFLCFTMYNGFGALSSGLLSVADMTDIFCKLNFNVVFNLRAIIDDLMRAQGECVQQQLFLLCSVEHVLTGLCLLCAVCSAARASGAYLRSAGRQPKD